MVILNCSNSVIAYYEWTIAQGPQSRCVQFQPSCFFISHFFISFNDTNDIILNVELMMKV